MEDFSIKEDGGLNKIERSWILYDVANSAFVLVIITTVMPIFFKDVAAAGVDSVVSTANWGFANAISSLLLAVMAPILGTIADYQYYKKRFLLFFFCLGFIFTLLLTLVEAGRWQFCLFFLSSPGSDIPGQTYSTILSSPMLPQKTGWTGFRHWASAGGTSEA